MKEAKNELMQFVGGVIMLVVGLYILSQKVMVSSSYGFFSLWGGRFSSGLIMVPLIIGVVWMFASGGSFVSKVFIVLSVILIIAAIVASTRIWLVTITMYEWVLILVLIFGGAGLVAKVLFANNKSEKSKKDKSEQTGGSYTSSVDDELDKMKKNLLSAESYMIGMSIPSRHLMLLSGHRSFMMSTSQRMTDSIIFILL